MTAYVSSAVTVLDRNPADGTLTYVQCWASDSVNPTPGEHRGRQPARWGDGPGHDRGRVAALRSSRNGNDVVRFARNGGTGSLSDPQNLVSTTALDGPQTLLVAPGGEAVYVGLFDGQALTTLSRDQSTGIPSLLGCLAVIANPSCTDRRGWLECSAWVSRSTAVSCTPPPAPGVPSLCSGGTRTARSRCSSARMGP